MTAPASGSVINASWDQVRAAAIAAGIDDARAAVPFERLLVPAPTPLATQRSPLASQSTLTRTVQTLIFAGVLLLTGAHAWWVHDEYSRNGFTVALPLLAGMLIALLAGAEVSLRRGADALAAVLAATAVVYATAVTYAALSLLGYQFDRHFSGEWPWFNRDWLPLEVAALVAALAFWARVRRPFVAFPAWLALVLCALDAGSRIFASERGRAIEGCVVAAVLVGIGIALDYRGLRRNAFWPHLVGIVVLAWGTGEALGDYRLGTLLCGIAFAALGVWLARSWHLAIGGLLVYGSLSSRDPSVGTLVLSGVLLVGVGIWLATSRSALRDWLAKRGLPAPQVD